MAMSTGRSAQEFPRGAGRGLDDHPERYDDFEEISLVDIARVIHKRRVVLAAVVVAALLAGAAITMFTAPEFEAKASVIPLAQGEIIRNWMGSRQAAEIVVDSVGPRLYPALYPDAWNAETETWAGAAPSLSEIANRLRDHVSVAGATGRESTLTVSVTLTSAGLAADVAGAYLGTLEQLRPELEAITRAELFDKYYDGTNGQEAQQRAETAAKQKNYWLVFDEPTVPQDPVKPRPVLNMALAGVLGIMGGVFVVFGLEWLAQFRSEFERVQPPPR